MTYLPWLLLGSTLTVRYALARGQKWGFMLDIASVPFWLLQYATKDLWPLLAIPLVFGYLDVMALRRWWR